MNDDSGASGESALIDSAAAMRSVYDGEECDWLTPRFRASTT
ncbi:hypothetical protein [Rhodococcus jostii]